MSYRVLFRAGWAMDDALLDPLRRLVGLTLRSQPPVATGAPPRPPRMVPAGWSHGGLSVLAAAARNPAAFHALVLIAATPRFCAAEDFPAGLPEANLRAMQRSLVRDTRGTLERFHRLCAAPAGLSAEEVEVRVASSLAIGLPSLQAGLHDLRERDLRAGVAGITIPVLLLHGGQDRVIPPAASAWLASRLPRATLAIHADAGHDLPVRHADWCAAQIVAFLRQHP